MLFLSVHRVKDSVKVVDTYHYVDHLFVYGNGIRKWYALNVYVDRFKLMINPIILNRQNICKYQDKLNLQK